MLDRQPGPGPSMSSILRITRKRPAPTHVSIDWRTGGNTTLRCSNERQSHRLATPCGLFSAVAPRAMPTTQAIRTLRSTRRSCASHREIAMTSQTSNIAPEKSTTSPERAELAQLGISVVTVEHFHYKTFRYTNVRDAIAQAQRDAKA